VNELYDCYDNHASRDFDDVTCNQVIVRSDVNDVDRR
jgi:hypothetical protein